MTAIIFRIIKQMTNDKRSLALMLAAPVLLLILTYLLLSDIEYVPQIAVTQDIPEAFTTALTAGGADVIRAGNADFKDLLGNEEVDAIIFMDNNTLMLIMLLLALTATSTGALISVFANNEFQVIQFIPLVIVPQAFLSGLIPREGLPGPLAYLAYIMPVYYGNEALKHVIVRGESIGQIYFYIIALFTIAVVLFAANTLILKRYRRL